MMKIVIVLASSFDNEGELSENTYKRLEKALQIAEEGTMFIVSGGATNALGEKESEKMKNYLVEKGILSGKVLTETRSQDTYGNLANIYTKYYDILNNGTVTLVTSTFHLFRVWLLAKRIVFPRMRYIGAKTSSNILFSYIRELGALIREFFLGRFR